MKKHPALMLTLTALFALSACSSAPQKKVASLDDVNLDQYLTERAIAQVQVGGELLAKMVGSVATSSEKQAILHMIEKTAQEQGIGVVKGMQLTADNLSQAFTEREAASIVKTMSKANPSLFSRTAFKKISAEADAALAKTSTVQNLGSHDNLSSNINLSNKAFQNDVKNLYYGFNKNPAYAKVYVSVRRNTGVKLWSQATCTTFGKLDAVAAKNLLTLGQDQAKIAQEVAGQANGAQATSCMIKKGTAKALNDFVDVLHVPSEQVVNTLEMAVSQCHLLPESYAAAAPQLVEANNGMIPAASDVNCN